MQFLTGLGIYNHHSMSLYAAAAAAAKSLQSCPTLCDPIDGSPPGSPIPGILQSRTLEWVAISFSNAWKWKVKEKLLSHVRLFAIPWTAAHQAPPSMGFSRQEYWSGVPSPSPMSLCALTPFSCYFSHIIIWNLLCIVQIFSSTRARICLYLQGFSSYLAHRRCSMKFCWMNKWLCLTASTW